MPRMRWRPGLGPGARTPLGELTTLPYAPPAVGWGGGKTPLPRTSPLRRLVSSVYPPIFVAIHHCELPSIG